MTVEVPFLFGPKPEAESETTFRLWAPDKTKVGVEIDGAHAALMSRDAAGFHTLRRKTGAHPRYRFRIGELAIPDPASRTQNGDVADESIVPDSDAYLWRRNDWKGRPWEETVLYELHVGLLGGFTGVMEHLPRLAHLGITAIELMPVADFPGRRNWGYDGVLPFAPDRAYGSPAQLKALVDRAHELDLMVFLDVVYNHFGPEGNWLATYAREFFRDDVHTPWGSAIDLRQPLVRQFFLENALYWINEFRLDGLRFDAVHAIPDRHLLTDFAAAIRTRVSQERHVHLVVENEDNESCLLKNGFDAQWNDDFHHAVHVLLTGEREGYYRDYADAPAQALARALREGFVYQGEPSAYRNGQRRGTPSGDLPPTAFVSFLQNHDQIGNRAFGERLTVLADERALRAAIALLLLSPQVPLIFMGEEAGAREPFLYFTDYGPELAKAVTEGRRAEFAHFKAFSEESARQRIPDPNAVATYEASRPQFDGKVAQEYLRYYAGLLRVRRERITPRLRGATAEDSRAVGPAAVLGKWRLGDGSRLTIASNLGKDDVRAALPSAAPLWGAPGEGLPRFSTLAWIEH